MAYMQQCSIRINLESECHLTIYISLLGIEPFEDIPEYKREILIWRTGLLIINVKPTTCLHHKHVYLKRYITKLTRCCNPFNTHNKVIKGSLCEINLDTAKYLWSKGKFIVLGEKLCPQCRHKLASSEESEENELEIKLTEDNMEREIILESTRPLLNSTLCKLEVSPLKVHLPKTSNKPSLGKRKIKQVKEAVIKKLATALQLKFKQKLGI
ncbi:ARL14 effector protein-like [Hydra vulgaris]|uniref:ARL14 effector protein-like n=1 Tax=Hydra vulgaris TaxID=6087 RepID=A0ABM4B1H9_HYDVU